MITVSNQVPRPTQTLEERAAEYDLPIETVRRLMDRSAKRGGLFYLQDFIDDVTEASVKRFKRLASMKSSQSQD